MTAARTAVALALVASTLLAARVAAQPPAAPPAPPAKPREAAPIDLTGQWVAIVNEDWRWRMVTPPKGDYASVPLNDEGRRVADQWDPAQDGACEAYGAAALLRMPTRLRIRWDGDARLVVETDAGRQVRNLDFGAAAAGTARSLQGQSSAKWVTPPRPAGGPGLAGAGGGGIRSRRRLPRGQDDEPDSGLAAPQRRAVQRGRGRHRVLRALRSAERRRVAHGHDDRR